MLLRRAVRVHRHVRHREPSREVPGRRRSIEVVGGRLLVAVGTWDLYVNLDSISRTFRV